jgi:hypothetical protein
MEIIEAIIKALLKNAAAGEIAFFLAGILFCMIVLVHYFQIFKRLDTNNDILREVVKYLEYHEKRIQAREWKKKLQRDDINTDDLA